MSSNTKKTIFFSALTASVLAVSGLCSAGAALAEEKEPTVGEPPIEKEPTVGEPPIMIEVEDGIYRIESLNGDGTLDIVNGSKKAGANVRPYGLTHTNAQRFKVKFDTARMGYTIQNVNSGLYLDVKNGKFADGTNIQQWTWNGSKSQIWEIGREDNGGFVSYPRLKLVGFGSA